jgi:16S rRNA G966 N2-methylase RsmD
MSCVGTSRTNPFDLVYLDPPFKSQQDYNVLFAEKDGTRTRYGCEFKTQTIQNILERVTE